jgi:hypothetical protein
MHSLMHGLLSVLCHSIVLWVKYEGIYYSVASRPIVWHNAFRRCGMHATTCTPIAPVFVFSFQLSRLWAYLTSSVCLVLYTTIIE